MRPCWNLRLSARLDAEGLVKSKAFVVLGEGQQASADELKDFVKERLAPYKYPRYIEFVDELPKTATGKIQRFPLARARSRQMKPAVEFVRPRLGGSLDSGLNTSGSAMNTLTAAACWFFCTRAWDRWRCGRTFRNVCARRWAVADWFTRVPDMAVPARALPTSHGRSISCIVRRMSCYRRCCKRSMSIRA